MGISGGKNRPHYFSEPLSPQSLTFMPDPSRKFRAKVWPPPILPRKYKYPSSK